MIPLRLGWWVIVAAVAVSPVSFPLAWLSEGWKATNVIGAVVCFAAWPVVAWPYVRSWSAAAREYALSRSFSEAVDRWHESFRPLWR